MKLIIDIGNTSAKLAVFDKNNLLEIFHSSNQTLNILDVICSKYTVKRAIIASVIQINDIIKKQLKKCKFHILELNHKTPIPITNCYDSKETLGMDRLAAVVGANGIFPKNNIFVIDAGTCITYDFIDNKGNYIGGNITPGLKMRFKALNYFTDKLPEVSKNGVISELGNNTHNAIRTGVIQGIKYEIKGFIENLSNKTNNLLVFLTGGDDFSFETNIKNIIFADRFLVLKGLNRILDYNDEL